MGRKVIQNRRSASSRFEILKKSHASKPKPKASCARSFLNCNDGRQVAGGCGEFRRADAPGVTLSGGDPELRQEFLPRRQAESDVRRQAQPDPPAQEELPTRALVTPNRGEGA